MGRKYIKLSPALDVIYDNADKLCWNVRNELYRKFNNVNCEGLCDEACEMLMKYLEDLKRKNNLLINIEVAHGELCHNSNFHSYNWPTEHSIIVVSNENEKIYIDPTCSQFKKLNKDIGFYYISDIKPWYLLLDKDNIRYKESFKLINSKINLKIKLKNNKCTYNGSFKIMKIGIISFCQYIIWGNISNIIYNLKQM